MPRVLAQAIVEVVIPPSVFSIGKFKVEVWGKEPYDYVRHYEIQAKSDTLAAQEGIRRFVEEMEQLGSEEE